jgi:hypothetical protein
MTALPPVVAIIVAAGLWAARSGHLRLGAAAALVFSTGMAAVFARALVFTLHTAKEHG